MQYPENPVAIGSTNTAAIKAIKERLNQLGYGPLDVNSTVFGNGTQDVIKHFQELNQLLADGVIGRLTWTRLFSPRANRPINSKILRFRALEIANTQLKVRELTGRNDGTEVKKYLASVGLGQGYAWCQAFVFWCYEEAAQQLGILNPIPKTAGVLDHYLKAKAKGIKIVTDPQEGDIGIMDFGGGKGHIFMVDARYLQDMFTIEGNTNDGGSREGDGVYERARKISSAKAYLRYE